MTTITYTFEVKTIVVSNQLFIESVVVLATIGYSPCNFPTSLPTEKVIEHADIPILEWGENFSLKQEQHGIQFFLSPFFSYHYHYGTVRVSKTCTDTGEHDRFSWRRRFLLSWSNLLRNTMLNTKHVLVPTQYRTGLLWLCVQYRSEKNLFIRRQFCHVRGLHYFQSYAIRER